MANFKRIVNVIPLTRIGRAAPKIFTYLVPLSLQGLLRAGQIVKVPFGKNRTVFGVVSSMEMHRLPGEVKGFKSVTQLWDAFPYLTEKNLLLGNWLSDYYAATLGLVIKAMLPKPVKKTSEPQTVALEKFDPDFVLTEYQRAALAQITAGLGKKAAFLIAGPRGSGKTEVCLQAASRVIESGRQVLFLVPDLAALERWRGLLIRRFGIGKLAVLGSHLTDAERLWTWKKIAGAERLVILGMRSAVFAPAKNLGAIIVGSEHHSSYKQYDQQPKYDARRVARKLAALWQCPVIFSSSTPSVELYFRSRAGRIALLHLPHSIKADLRQPQVKLAVMKSDELALSPALQVEITQALLAKHAALLVFTKAQSGLLADELQAMLHEEFRRAKPEIVRLAPGEILIDPAHRQAPVSVIGATDADFYLRFRDFRAAERAFQSLGAHLDRFGAGNKSGVLVLQTAQPEHYVMKALRTGSYETFYNAEIEKRKANNDPPFSKLVKISRPYKVLRLSPDESIPADELRKLPATADIDVDPESLI